jgi:hypothetical protein
MSTQSKRNSSPEESSYRMRDLLNSNALDSDEPRDDPETTWLELLRRVIFDNGWYASSRLGAKRNYIRPGFGNVGTLARLCKLSEGTTVKLLTRLQELGEIRCDPDPENCTDIYMTANARRVAEERKSDKAVTSRRDREWAEFRASPASERLACHEIADALANAEMLKPVSERRMTSTVLEIWQGRRDSREDEQ